jgi:hypothetical protein
MVSGLVVAFQATLSVATAQVPRPLAPGVLRVIAPEPLPEETFSGPLPLVEIVRGGANLQWTPHYLPPTQTLLAKANQTIFRRSIWCLEFSFKPLRLIEVDLPTENGKLVRKYVWYLVYRIRYLGNDLKPAPVRDAYGHETFPGTVAGTTDPTPRFFPHFVLRIHDFQKEYLDVVLPSVKSAIVARERPGVPLYNSVEMTSQVIPLSQDENDPGVWGYATWIDIDPRLTFFSIYVGGLTNAHRFTDAQDGFKPGDPPLTGRQFQQKVLQLNFWRPGDSVLLNEEEIRFGIPIDTDPKRQQEYNSKYGLSERLDYLWVYR